MPIKKLASKDRAMADEQINQFRTEVEYDVRDYTIEFIIKKFIDKEYLLPWYQRKYIWNQDNKSKFIESILLGLPIPFMFLAETKDGKFEIVDGAQRIQTLADFCKGKFKLNKLKKLTSLNSFSYSDLSESQQRKFLNRPLRLIILEERTTEESKQEIFSRINTHGEKIRPIEARKGAFSGAFMKFLEECTRNELFIKLCPISVKLKKRGEGEELLLRFFCYIDNYKEVGQYVRDFLDDYAAKMSQAFEENPLLKPHLESNFKLMLTFANMCLPQGTFVKGGRVPHARFEALSVGIIEALRERPTLNTSPTEVEVWINSPEFSKHTRTDASNNPGRLTSRIEYVKRALLGG